MSFFRSIAAKILVPVIVMTIVLVAVTVTFSIHTFSKFADELFTEKVEETANNVGLEISTQHPIRSTSLPIKLSRSTRS